MEDDNDQLITKERAKAFIKKNGLMDAAGIEAALMKGAQILIQEMLDSELDKKLGYDKYDIKNKDTDNSRNGHSKKTVKSNFGEIPLKIPRDIKGAFEPVLIGTHQRRLPNSIENAVLAFYAKGMSQADISCTVEKVFHVEISAETISTITDKVLPIVVTWQNRPLESIYSIVYLDGIMFNVNQDGHVIKKTAYVVYGININGMKEILGIWLGEAESSKFWMKVLMDLRNRGVKDILIAAVDGLKGFVEAINAVFPKTEVQKCIVHQIRNSVKFVSYKDLKEFCNDMKPIYHAPNEEAALLALEAFEEKWGKKYGYAVKSWKENWANISTFFKYPPEIRRLIYTTNPIEGLNRRFRKITKTKGSFPSDEALFKLLYLVVEDVSSRWTLPIRNWAGIVQQLGVYFGERMEVHMQTA